MKPEKKDRRPDWQINFEDKYCTVIQEKPVRKLAWNCKPYQIVSYIAELKHRGDQLLSSQLDEVVGVLENLKTKLKTVNHGEGSATHTLPNPDYNLALDNAISAVKGMKK